MIRVCKLRSRAIDHSAPSRSAVPPHSMGYDIEELALQCGVPTCSQFRGELIDVVAAAYDQLVFPPPHRHGVAPADLNEARGIGAQISTM